MKKILIGLLALVVTIAAALWWLSRPDVSRLSNAELTGRVPVIGEPRVQSALPTINIAHPVPWPADAVPTPAPGLAVNRFAVGLDHPRNMYVLPNGDVLVAETNSPPREGGGISGWFARYILGSAGAGVPSANRITLLRDADGDGVAEVKTPFLTGLNSPYGMALIGTKLYVTNTDALMVYDYVPGATSITGAGRKVINLPASGANSHWTKTLVASADGRILYVGIGSNSNIGDGGMAWERGRAQVIEVRPDSNYHRPFASGIRNPSGLAIHPITGALWASVNERDMLGSDMVPDYMTELELGDFYGWPWYYWGGFLDDRVPEPDSDDRRSYVARPDYALGAHVAPLGMSFATNPALGAPWGNGAFVALHGSWNRVPRAGYKVVFVAFGDNGKPSDALPLDVLTGFINADGNAMGRPADARQGRDGALLVADDVGNIIWRVSRAAPPAQPR
ncbi:MAG: sorbosone dehydrogenase family protein [Sphingopyxis sp.]